MTLTKYNAVYPAAIEVTYDLLNEATIKLTCPYEEFNCNGCPVKAACDHISAARTSLHSMLPPAPQAAVKYYKETAGGKPGQPYRRTEITRADALLHVSSADLTAMEEHVQRHPGIGELLEVGPGTYVGVATW